MSKEIIRPEQFACASMSINEESLELNQEQIKELQDLYTGTFERFTQGKLIDGAVLKKDSDGVVVDIGYKSLGIIPLYEFSKHELEKLEINDQIEVILDELENVEGQLTLSYEKAKALKAWSQIIKLCDEGKPVEGVVTHKVKGGLSVDVGIPAFLPGSQVDLQRVADFDQFVGQKITAYVIKVNQKRGNVIISRRKYLNEQRSEVRKQVLDELGVDKVIQGAVKNITNYGAFIDIGGVDGLLHITDMTWGRIGHPSEMLKIGDMVTVKVLSFDRDNEKISLGMKQLTDNPWQQAADKLAVGQKITGRVGSIADYGLFVEVFKGVEGLVHISEVSWKNRIDDLRKHFKVGDEVEALVVSFDPENRRMSLSIKKLEGNPWQKVADTFKVGEIIKGKISNLTDFGVFIELASGVDGLVHISDLSWTEHVAHPSDKYQIGQEVEAKILSIEPEKQKISLGIKQLDKNPWELIDQEYPLGSMVAGTVAKLANFGAFIKLPSGIEGLIRSSELPDGQKLEEFLKIGDAHTFRIIKVNKEEQKIALSLRPAGEQKPIKPVVSKPAKQQDVSAGDVQDIPAASKTKSQFQLELEKHRNTDEQE